MSDKYTAAQRRAVTETEGNMLVSASAGSGKTFVMIERVIKLVVEGKAKVSEILAVTFTEAAAAEMKQKLVTALRKKLADGEDNSAIRAALEEVPAASISTIHKFCADLLRCYFYEIGLDPTFKVADETVADEIRNAAAQKVFERLYDDGNEDFLYLVRIFRTSRKDDELKNTVKKLAEAASSEKNPEEFIAFCGKEPKKEDFCLIENELTRIFKERASALKKPFAEVKRELDEAGVKKTDDYFKEISAKLEDISGSPSLAALVAACAVGVRKSPSVPKELENEKKRFDDLKKKLKKLCDDSAALMPDGESAAEAAFLSTGKTVKALADLTLLYKKEYDEMKADESFADFSDLEHLAYKLLTVSSDALKSVQNKYKYAFCDEYQDVSAVQEAVLSLVAPGRLFMVGDVKQCIYAFRGCNPAIFAEKYDEFSQNESLGKAIALAENFRSADGVLAAVNKVFSATMTKKSSTIEYSANPMVFGKLYPENTGSATMHVITGENAEKKPPSGVYDLVKDATTEEEADGFYEGLLVGEIIESELGKTIYDIKKGEYREVKPKDIAVLLRNSKGFATEVIKTLSRLAIPVTSVAKNSIIDYPEIRLLIDVLKLIDFYADDAPLIAALKSPIGGLDEEELAAVRAETPDDISVGNEKSEETDNGKKDKKKDKPTFLECAEYYVNNGENPVIREKLRKFDEYFKKIRLLAEFEGAGELLVKVIKDCSLDLDILTGKLGELRLERVNRFIAESEKGGVKLGVREFLKKLENIGDNLSLSEAGGNDSVSVMSMHASKGLEFPVVIVAGLGRQFNAADERENLLISKKRGLAPYAYDESSMTKISTLKREIIKIEKQKDTAREELRLLYVAMTRAQSTLHLITSIELPPERTDDTAAAARRFSEFFSPEDMKTVYHEKSEITGFAKAESQRRILVSECDAPLKQRISESIGFVYPFAADTLLPVKKAVTSISEESAFNEKIVFKRTDGEFTGEETERGTAYHKFLENWDLTEKSADNELIRQLSQGILSARQAELIDKTVLSDIVSAPVFGELKGYRIYKEQPFVVSLSAPTAGYKEGKGEILVQGVIDLLAVKGDEAVIVDYKLTRKTKEAMIAAYKTQLSLYKKAVEKVLKIKVKKAVLLNLFTCETADVTTDE